MALGMVRNVYSKQFISRNTKIRYYNTSNKPAVECYASETLALNRKLKIEIKNEKRKVNRKILSRTLMPDSTDYRRIR